MALRILGWAARRERALVAAICALLAVAGAVYALLLGPALPYLDEQDYHAIAVNLARHGTFSVDGVTPTAWRPPGYPLLLAVPAALGGGVPQLRLLNVAALVLTVALAAALARRIAPAPAGLLAALMAAGYPLLFYTAGTLFPQTVAAALLLAALWLLAGERPGPGRLLAAGALFGLLILAVPTFIFQLAVVAAWLAWSRRAPLLRAALAFVLPALVVVGAWSARNAAVFGAFVFVTTNAGLPLLIGNYPGATPDADPARYLADLEPVMTRAAALGEVEADRLYRAEALAFITGQPAEALALYGRKVLNYFSPSSALYAAGEATPLRDLVLTLTYTPLLALLAARLLLARRLPVGPVELLVIGLYLSNALFAAIFFTKVRYRVPFDPLLLVVAAAFLAALAGGAARHPGRRRAGRPALAPELD